MLNILIIPAFSGGISHQIPLFVLYDTYLKVNPHYNTAFLLPASDHQRFTKQGVNVLPIDYYEIIDASNIEQMRDRTFKLLAKEEKAIEMFKPSIIIDDSNIISYINCLKFGIPRVSIHRTGFFRSLPQNQRNPKHVHSLEKGKSQELPQYLIFTVPEEDTAVPEEQLEFIKATRTVRDLMLGSKSKLIPGIPSIEVLSQEIKERNSYFHCGPLNLTDNCSKALYDELEFFFSIHQNRKKVFISTGLIEQQNITPIIQHLLDKKYCIISSVPFNGEPEDKRSFYYNPFLPLHHVCSKVDLIVHHCGSGIYHYPLVHQKPSITFGTQCYDREDVAIRLQQLEVSKHTPSPCDNAEYMDVFKEHLEKFEKDELCNKNTLKMIKEEISNTMSVFNVQNVIEYALK